MTEVEKMRSSQLADMSAPELQVNVLNMPKTIGTYAGNEYVR